MTRIVRMLVVAATACLALAVAGPATAAYNSARLFIDNPSERLSGGGTLTIKIQTAQQDDATFRAAIYIPQGYFTSLVPQVGQDLGTAAATVNATAISPDAIVPVTGRIVGDAYDAAKYPQGRACVGTAEAIDGVWRLELSAAGQTLIVPMYVVTVTAGPEAAFASGKLVTCLPSPYAEAGPARASLGAKLISATLKVKNVFTNPTTPGDYRWRALFTPWTVNSGTPNMAGSVETQAVDRIPAQLTLTARKNDRRNTITLTGVLTENRVGLAGVPLHVYRGAKVIGKGKTRAGGRYTITMRVKPGRYVLRTRAFVGPRPGTASACSPTAVFGGVPCLNATVSGFRIYNNGRAAVLRVR